MKHAEKWQIELKAETSLLEKLSDEFCNPELRIFHDSERWFLDSTYLDSEESVEIYEEGEQLIGYLNHTLWLYAYRLNPIKSHGYYLLTSARERLRKFDAIGRASAPMMIIVHSNDIPGTKSFDLFAQNLKVRESLALFNNAGIDWFTLYKLYETARDDEPDIPTSGDGISHIEQWGGKDDNDRFHKTATWHRHSVFGKSKGKPNAPPSNPMSLSEAQRFIRRVLIGWLDHKSTIRAQDSEANKS